jgi:hypothetical protein
MVLYLHSIIATMACLGERFTFTLSQHNLHNYSSVIVRRNVLRQHSRGKSILRFSLLYNLVSLAHVVPKYLNFAVQADRSSYELDIRQMLLFIRVFFISPRRLIISLG